MYYSEDDGCWLSTTECTMECADAAHGLGGHIITDGGCVVGDIAKSSVLVQTL